MTYATIMVHLQPGRSNARILGVAAELADRFHAAVVGIAACQPIRIVYSEGYIPTDILDKDRAEREAELAAAEAEFRGALSQNVRRLAWRSGLTDAPLGDYFAHEARLADLIVTGVDREATVFDHTRHLDLGYFVMNAGRPVLIVPSGREQPKFDRALIGWKDSRETRRAVADALPMLKKAAHVVVTELAHEDELGAAAARVEDVRHWLEGHGVRAEIEALASTGDDAHRLHALMLQHKADFLVAGAYGHSRMREWVFGGVTRDLLLKAGRCALVSH